MGQKRAIKRQRPIKRDKGVKASQWRKQFSKQIMLKQLDICMFLKKSWSKFHTVYQNELKLVLSLNVKSKSIKLLEDIEENPPDLWLKKIFRHGSKS